jgi:hypothetical protein
MPAFDHAMLPIASLTDPYLGVSRENIDPDDFTGGFALSSGTSFAAPVLAGRIAQELISQSAHPEGIALKETGDLAVERTQGAVERVRQRQEAKISLRARR